MSSPPPGPNAPDAAQTEARAKARSQQTIERAAERTMLAELNDTVKPSKDYEAIMTEPGIIGRKLAKASIAYIKSLVSKVQEHDDGIAARDMEIQRLYAHVAEMEQQVGQYLHDVAVRDTEILRLYALVDEMGQQAGQNLPAFQAEE